MEDISKLFNFVGQFILALKKAGFTKENFQEVISSKGNKIANDLFKVVSGNYELIQKSLLVKNGLMAVKAFSGNITELFSEQKTGKNKQWHSGNFKKLLK